jgi:nitroreductase
MIELNEAIRQRHSVRRYTSQSIEPEKVAILQEAIGKFNAESGLNIQLVLEEPKAFSSFLVTYGAFSGVKNYFVMAAPKGKEWEEKVGYFGEKLVLLSQALGLNTCWVGLTYKKIPDAYLLREGDIIHCEISLGYGANQGVQHPLRPIDKFFEADGEVPGWFKAGLEAALLAPTAVNQQKFKFILRDGNLVEAQALRSMVGYAIIDLGIVKCHFELGAGVENFTWK